MLVSVSLFLWKHIQMRLSKQFVLAVLFFIINTFDFPFIIRYNIAKGGRETMKKIKRQLVLDDFEYRLLVGCVNKARAMFLDADKPVEDVSVLLLKIINAPTKKMKWRNHYSSKWAVHTRRSEIICSPMLNCRKKNRSAYEVLDITTI